MKREQLVQKEHFRHLPSPRLVRAFTRGCELLPHFIGGTVLLGLTGNAEYPVTAEKWTLNKEKSLFPVAIYQVCVQVYM